MRQRERFEGQIAGLGSTSGVRVVVGHWARSPFGAFTDAMVVRYVDDAYRSRVSGMRLAVSFGVASVAVYSLGPTVKAAGFDNLLLAMAAIACCSLVFVSLLPGDPVPVAPPAPA